MTKKIYEYKDANDWFIGTWGGYNTMSRLGEDIFDDDFYNLNRFIDVTGEEEGYDVTIVRLTSPYRLVSFVLDIINQEKRRNLKAIQHQGAVLISEDDRLLSVYIPKEGVALTDFFGGQQTETGFGDTILIATKNEGKTKEFRAFFDKLGYKVENLNNYPDLPDVEETGTTFEANARLKAETISKLTGKMVLADDSGLKVDSLGGLPGVWSARFSGADATDAKNNAKLLHELAMVFDQKDRSAQFHCTLVVAAPERESLVVEADWEGYIGFEARGEHGFGYDPLFLVGDTGQTSAELPLEEKNKISHRAKALEKLLEAFPVWQNK